MIVHTAHLVCRPEVVEAFQARLLRHAGISRSVEPGCRRFDVHQDRDQATRFLLIEHYDNLPALQAHRASDHYRSFREDTAEWVVSREWWFWDPLTGNGDAQQR